MVDLSYVVIPGVPLAEASAAATAFQASYTVLSNDGGSQSIIYGPLKIIQNKRIILVMGRTYIYI